MRKVLLFYLIGNCVILDKNVPLWIALQRKRKGMKIMNSIKQLAASQREYFSKGKTLDISFRLIQLKKLRHALKKHETDLLQALQADLNKPKFEGYAAEVGLVLEELSNMISHLAHWAKAKIVPASLANFPSIGKIYSEPYGNVLIMSPWNYPVLLSLQPLIGALAAGNCVVLKPSEYSPNVSHLLKKILDDIYPAKYVVVMTGGRMANQELLAEKFDYIFFTGSVSVGKIVMESASKNLTPITLELGGKSPCIVDKTANLDLAAKRIVWGKFLNAGQTCVAPDYLLVQSCVKDELLEKMRQYILKFYGTHIEDSKEFPKIINEKHFNRLISLLDNGTVVTGGEYNPLRNQISPTILDNISIHSPIMQEEIFGPILPVLTFTKLDEVITYVKEHPKPLAAYYFTNDKRREQYVMKHLSFGGGCINDTIMHLANSTMPFGGVGDSGMGGYHGKYSFDTFSHKKSMMKKALWPDLPFRYPPYKEKYFKILKMILS